MKSVRTRKTKLEIPLPEGWHDVSFANGYKILTEADKLDDIQILSLVSGVPEDTLKKETDYETIHYLLNSLLFLSTVPLNKNPEFPKSVNGIDLPYVNYADKYDLGNAEVGQVEDMKAYHRSKETKNDLEVIEMFPRLCAIYLQPIYQFQDYDHTKIDQFEEDLKKELDFKTVCNMGAFFLKRLNGLMYGSKTGWQNPRHPKRKFKLAFKNLAQRLVSMLP